MKKTEYFTTQVAYHAWDDGITSVKEQRDEFLKLNESAIVKIDDENLTITPTFRDELVIILKLTYYNK